MPYISYLRLGIISNSSKHIFLWENKTFHVAHGPYISSAPEIKIEETSCMMGEGKHFVVFCVLIYLKTLPAQLISVTGLPFFSGNRPWRYPSSPKQRVQLGVFLSNGKRRCPERRSFASIICYSQGKSQVHYWATGVKEKRFYGGYSNYIIVFYCLLNIYETSWKCLFPDIVS